MNYIRKGAKMSIGLSLSHKAALASVLAAAFGLFGVASAHHSFAMFDMGKTLSIEGTVKDFQWTNPHVWIEVVASTPDGLKQYSVEGTTVRVLKGAGWKFNTLKPGDKVTVVMNPMRDGSPGGSLVSATLPDGRLLKSF
jgi:hypothetical protein